MGIWPLTCFDQLVTERPEPPKWYWSKETAIALFALTGIAVYLILRFALQLPPDQNRWPLLATLCIGGAPLLWDLLKNVVRGEFGSDLLAGMSIAVSLALGEWLAGSIVVLMLSGGTALEHYATRRASAILAALASRMPHKARRKEGSSGFLEVSIEELRVGDSVVVFPHEICPVDGVVTEGRGSMDESYLTGEPFQISKLPGAEVLSGAINGESALTVTVGKLPGDSRYAKIMKVMQAAEANRPRMRRIADRLGAWYTVLGVAVAALGWYLGNDASRFLAVLVIATPCPLLLAIPVAIVGAISLAASRGIIIKNPPMLEKVGSCRTVIFDKTGTLTYGKPTLTECVPASGITEEKALRIAASLEQYSKHPLAGSVIEAARERGLSYYPLSEISEKPGRGLTGKFDGVEAMLTGRKAVLATGACTEAELPPVAAGMECILMLDGAYAATFRFHDTPRKDSVHFVQHLGPRHQVGKVMLLSGDREAEVSYLAAEVGIDAVFYGKSPEEKLAIVREEAAKTPTLFLGDGINDAPAMQAATCGVAFGQTSDITAEAADAVILEASLGKVDELIHIGDRMRTIAMQSAVGGMALSAIGMGFAAAGILNPVMGAIAQEIIDVFAVLNALRVAIEAGELRDYHPPETVRK